MTAVSVVIPCYNAAKFLPLTLESVRAQQGVELEVVVVDDGSTDHTAQMLERAFPEVRLIQQRNSGVAAARNKGIESARHEWVAFLDADDVWLPGKLAAQMQVLADHPEASMAYSAWEVWRSQALEPPAALCEALAQECMRPEEPAGRRGASGWIYPELLEDCVVWTSTVVARRQLLQDLGGFEVGRRIGEDYDLWLRASRRTPIIRVNRPYALYRLHANNTTARAPERNHKADVVERAIRQWGYTGADGRKAQPRRIQKGLAQSWRAFGAMCMSDGRLRDAACAAFRAVQLEPENWLNWRLAARLCLSPLMRRPA